MCALAALALSLPGRAAGSATEVRPYPVRVDTIVVAGLARTQPSVVLRELLFAAGDTVDSAAVAESARNLRRLLFLADATIRLAPGPAPAGPARLEVQVRELHARALSPVAAGDLDEPSYGVVALDYNLFGAGQIGRLTLYRDAVQGHSAALLYRAPRALGPDVDVETNLRWADEGHRVQVGAGQPFRTLGTRWSWAVEAADAAETQRLYYGDGGLAARYRERRRWAAASVTRSVGSATKLRTGLSLSLGDWAFETRIGPEYTPADRRRLTPSARLVLWRPRYARARFVHALGRAEDLQTGSWLSLRVGGTHRALGSDRGYPFAAVALAPAWHLTLGSGTYVWSYAGVSSRYARGGHENLVALVQTRVYSQYRGRHTAALRLRLEALSRMEDDTQLLLGVNAGLRGHRPRSQNGTRRALANVELRQVLWQRRHLTVAGAAFVDAGRAWSHGGAATRVGAGLGLRLGLPQVYATPVLRLDMARGLPHGVTQVVFGTGHYF